MTGKPRIFKPPQVDKVIRDPILAPWHKRVQSKVITHIVRIILDSKRAAFLNDNRNAGDAIENFDENSDLSASELAQLAANELEAISTLRLNAVINGTGIIINTNLGRAPIAKEVLSGTLKTLSSYCDLELDLELGKRGRRTTNVETLLQLITGCQAALVVNNNASSVMLAIHALSANKEVIVSRGELLEIGGSFRLPEVIEAASGKLNEVGTTNRTRASDYAKAINSESGIVFKCHQSNFEMRGFVEEANVSELAAITQAARIPLVEDLGSGCLIDLEKFGFKHERTVQECLSDGANLVMFSGDKLLGGPQAGIIVGDKHLVEQLRKHPIYRALRADKILVSILEEVLHQYLAHQPEELIPVLVMAKQLPQAIAQRVENFITSAQDKLGHLHLDVHATESAFGGGTSPSQTQPSFALRIKVDNSLNLSINDLNKLLRNGTPKVIARMQDESILIDFRTVQADEEFGLSKALISIETTLGKSV
jgi:L-seryl-tRNA(Ser) seleniumtransferase